MTTLNTLIEEKMEELKKRFVFIDEQLGAILVGDAEEFLYVFREMSNHIAQATRDAVRVEKLDIVESVMKDPELEQYMKEATGHNSAISEQEKRAEEWLKE